MEINISPAAEITFKDFAIQKPCYINDNEPDPNEYNVVKRSGSGWFVIAKFYWDYKEPCWKFESIGTRYLEHYCEGLNDWMLDAMKLLKHKIEED